MNKKEFFNSVAYKWDEMCNHDDNKLKRIIKLAEVKKDSKILDVGTGTGILINYLLGTSPEKITAIDISDNMIEVAKSKYRDARVEFIVKDIMEYDEKGYDYIFLYSVYPHILNKEALFLHLSAIVNTGGKIIIAHSESREKINNVHKSCDDVCDDILPSAEITSGIMSKYFKVEKSIDSDEMYYVTGVKE